MSNAQHTYVPAQLDPRRWWALALLCHAPSTRANGAPRARPVCAAASG
jgi:hypothetical protein